MAVTSWPDGITESAPTTTGVVRLKLQHLGVTQNRTDQKFIQDVHTVHSHNTITLYQM